MEANPGNTIRQLTITVSVEYSLEAVAKQTRQSRRITSSKEFVDTFFSLRREINEGIEAPASVCAFGGSAVFSSEAHQMVSSRILTQLSEEQREVKSNHDDRYSCEESVTDVTFQDGFGAYCRKTTTTVDLTPGRFSTTKVEKEFTQTNVPKTTEPEDDLLQQDRFYEMAKTHVLRTYGFDDTNIFSVTIPMEENPVCTSSTSSPNLTSQEITQIIGKTEPFSCLFLDLSQEVSAPQVPQWKIKEDYPESKSIVLDVGNEFVRVTEDGWYKIGHRHHLKSVQTHLQGWVSANQSDSMFVKVAPFYMEGCPGKIFEIVSCCEEPIYLKAGASLYFHLAQGILTTHSSWWIYPMK